MSFNDEDTVENIPVYVDIDPVVAESPQDAGIEIAAVTHRGKVRAHNEDHYAVIRRTRSERVLASSLPDAEDQIGDQQHAWLLAVADGLGGHVSGEVASATAIRTILNFAQGLSSWIVRPHDGLLREDFAERVDLYVDAIQQNLRQQARANPGLEGMATTVTAAYVFGESAIVVNVGDSRSYLVRPNKIEQVTVDHTLAKRLQDEGLSPAMTRRFSNVVTRTLNTDGKSVDVDIFHVTLSPGDRILLCSDGLTDMLSDEAIMGIVNLSASAKAACEQLVRTALDNGGRDNVTVLLARV